MEYRIIVVGEQNEKQKKEIIFFPFKTDIHYVSNFQEALFRFTYFPYHLILVAIREETETINQFVETVRKLTLIPMIVLFQDDLGKRKKLVELGADIVLNEEQTEEEVVLHIYALIRRNMLWIENREKDLAVGSLKISYSQRKTYWNNREVLLVKREFDFLYLLANTPGRVYTYSQIYRVVWKEYPYGDITNIIYCMVHRLKQKLKKIEPNAQYIICSVKEVGYCLKNV